MVYGIIQHDGRKNQRNGYENKLPRLFKEDPNWMDVNKILTIWPASNLPKVNSIYLASCRENITEAG